MKPVSTYLPEPADKGHSYRRANSRNWNVKPALYAATATKTLQAVTVNKSLQFRRRLRDFFAPVWGLPLVAVYVPDHDKIRGEGFAVAANILRRSGEPLRIPQTDAKYSQRQRSLRREFCRGLERTRRQVAVPTLARQNRADVCETAAIYSLSLLARFLSLSPRIVQVSHSNSESWHHLAIRMSFVGRLRRVGRDTFHSCVLFTHTSESACMCLVVSDFPHGVY